MLQNILGKGVASKLWPLRDEEKLAYNVQSRFTLFAYCGILEAYIETENTKQETAFNSFKQVLNEVYTKGLTPEELDTNKSFTKSSLLIQNETKQDRVGSTGFYETMGLGYDFFNKVFKTIDAITLEDLNTFIHQHLDPEKAVYVVIGPNDN
jgi:zinc protease